MDLYFQQEEIGGKNRLVLGIADDTVLDQFILNIMNHNVMEYLSPIQLVQFNKDNYLQFDVSQIDTLNNKISKLIKKNDVFQILSSFIGAFEEAEAYMMSENNIYLNLDYIFVDEKNKCSFIYLPFKETLLTDKIVFLKNLVEQMRPDYSEKDTYIFNIINAFGRGAIKKISDLKDILQKSNEDFPSVDKEIQPDKLFTVNEIIKDKPEKICKIEIDNNMSKLNEKITKGASAILNIPGKGIMPINIPETAETLKNNTRPNISKKREEKKWSGIKFFGKKKIRKNDMENTGEKESSDTEIQKNICNSKNTDMYESYEATVMMQSPPISFSSVQQEMTVYLAPDLNAELERKKTGEHIKITCANVVLGSGTSADCRIADNKAISRIHATINLHNDLYYVVDNNSRNGTWVNGNRLIPEREVEIQNNAEIKLADEEFIFKLQ